MRKPEEDDSLTFLGVLEANGRRQLRILENPVANWRKLHTLEIWKPEVDDSLAFRSTGEQTLTTVSHRGDQGNNTWRQFYIPAIRMGGDDSFTFWRSRALGATLGDSS